MNVSTGLYRLAQVIKWGGRVIGGLWASGGLWVKVNSGPIDLIDFAVYFGIGAVIVAITGGIAWVLEGFAND